LVSGSDAILQMLNETSSMHPMFSYYVLFPSFTIHAGNLYYALTHSPEPLTEEYSHALSWEAATERFVAAGSISVAEAEAMEEALSSAEAGIDVSAYLLFHNCSISVKGHF